MSWTSRKEVEALVRRINGYESEVPCMRVLFMTSTYIQALLINSCGKEREALTTLSERVATMKEYRSRQRKSFSPKQWILTPEGDIKELTNDC